VSVRVDLDGNTVGEVTPAQTRISTAARTRQEGEGTSKAQEELEHKAQLDAERDEVARKQSEKLNQLVSKFSRS